jgi:lipopolysaccharide export system permease protein
VRNRLLSIIDGYLLGQVLKAFAAILLVLIIALFSNQFVRVLGWVAEGRVSATVLMPIVGFEILKVSGILMPPAFFFAVLYVIGRMYRDSEMVALEATGVGTVRVYRAVLGGALPVALVSAVLTMAVLPWSNAVMEQLKTARSDAAELAGISAGRFNEYSRGDLVFYLETFSEDRSGFSNVFVQHRQHDKVGIVTAREGRQFIDEETGDRFVVFTDGQRYEGTPGEGELSVAEFSEYAVRVRRGDIDKRKLARKARPTAELWRSDKLDDRSELQYRLSFPLAVLAFAVVSVPLGRSLPRQGIHARLLRALLVYFVFMNLQRAAQNWMEAGDTPAWLGMWWVHLTMVLIAGVLLLTDSLRFVQWRTRMLRRLRR